MIFNVSLAAVRISISALNTAVVAEWDSTLGSSGGAMIQGGGRWGVEDEIVGIQIVGHEAHT
jgi:hypothetical protein